MHVDPPRGSEAAVLALTRPALTRARQLAGALPRCTLFVPPRYVSEAGGAGLAYGEPLASWVRERFHHFGAWVFFAAVGTVVRILAPVLRDKHSDPAVVVLDPDARFAISLLSGHRGGGNALAVQVADILGAQAVITTASDTQETLAVDLLGADLGWRIEDETHVTRLSACVVNGERVGILQEAGPADWWPADRPLPPNLLRLADWGELRHADCAGYLLITDRVVPEDLPAPAVVYRPPSLVAGVGCRRGASAGEIERAVRVTLADAGLAFVSLDCVATAERKHDEEGLNAFAASHGLRIRHYPESELAGVLGPTPSEQVRRVLGTPGVCEPAALLASGLGELLVAKRKFTTVTVAIARKASHG